MKITRIKEAKNIEFYGKGNIKSIDGAEIFLLTIEIEEMKNKELYFLLDESSNNNFDFSVYKDFENKIQTLTIEGDKKQSFAIVGYELRKVGKQ